MNTVAIVPSRTITLVEQFCPQVADQVDLLLVMDNGLEGVPASKPSWDARFDCVCMGIHEMWNCGINQARRAYRDNVRCLFLNDDVAISPDFVEKLSWELDRHDDLMAICGNYDLRGGPPVTYTGHICAGQYDGTGGFAGFGFMLSEHWTGEPNNWLFDERMMWWGGDNDLLASIHQAGYRAGIARDAHMTHLDGGSRTIGKPGEMDPEMMRRCALDVKYLQEKWS